MNAERATLLAMPATRLIAAQIESLGINGAGLARGADAIGFRAIPLLAAPDYGRFDGKLPICTLKDIGPYDTAGCYHHVSFLVPATQAALHRFLRLELINANSMIVPDFQPEEAATVHFEWAFDGSTLGARIGSDRPLDLMVLMNGCLKPAVVTGITTGAASLEQNGWRIYAGMTGKMVAHAQESDIERLEVRLRGLPLAANEAPACVTGHLFRLLPGAPIHVTLAETPTDADPRLIDERLEAGRLSMNARLMRSAGAAEHCADAIQSLVGFSSNYNPESGLRKLPVNRDWAGPNSGSIEAMWDHFFDPYLGCFHDPELSKEALRNTLYIIETLGMHGATLPSQRNLIVPIVYSKMVRFMGDRAFAEMTLPTIMTFLRFYFGDRGDGHAWRDGNDDGLIELGSCLRPGETQLGRIIQNAFDETGYDDSPMYSEGFSYEWRGLPAKNVEFDFNRGTLNLTMVGQNSLYVAACRSVAVVADWVKATGEAMWLRSEADRVARRMRERLLDPEVGYYRNRFFNGNFSPVKTMDMFYPLLAEVCDEPVDAKLRKILLDPRQFWGDNVIPTVSRDDPAYRDDRIHDPYWKGNYWRGNIWPPTNYIAYLAIRQAGWTDVAAEFSAKSRRLFMDDWLARRHANENYPPEGGTDRTHMFAGYGGRDPHYVWAGLLPLISLEELFAVEDTAPGIRFGSMHENSWGSWEGFLYHGHKGSIRCNARGVCLDIADFLHFSADNPVAIRMFLKEGSDVRFRYTASAAVHIEIQCDGQCARVNLSPGENRDARCCVC